MSNKMRLFSIFVSDREVYPIRKSKTVSLFLRKQCAVRNKAIRLPRVIQIQEQIYNAVNQ